MFDSRSAVPADTSAAPETRPRTAAPPPLCVAAGPGAYDLEARVGRHLAQARRHGAPLALLSVALAGADVPPGLRAMVVPEFGRRLLGRLRGTDEVWQTGELEFTAVLTGCRPNGALAARRRLFGALGEVYQVGAGIAHVSASIGLACHPTGSDGALELLAAARASREGEFGAGTRRA